MSIKEAGSIKHEFIADADEETTLSASIPTLTPSTSFVGSRDAALYIYLDDTIKALLVCWSSGVPKPNRCCASALFPPKVNLTLTTVDSKCSSTVAAWPVL